MATNMTDVNVDRLYIRGEQLKKPVTELNEAVTRTELQALLADLPVLDDPEVLHGPIAILDNKAKPADVIATVNEILIVLRKAGFIAEG